MACFIGAFLYVAPLALAGTTVVFVLAVAMSKHISLGSIVGALVFPILFWGLEHPPQPILLASIASALLIVYRHRANIERLRQGTESVFSFPWRNGAVSPTRGSKLAILGAGSWGTALAIALSSRFEAINLWSHNAGRAAELQLRRGTSDTFPGLHSLLSSLSSLTRCRPYRARPSSWCCSVCVSAGDLRGARPSNPCSGSSRKRYERAGQIRTHPDVGTDSSRRRQRPKRSGSCSFGSTFAREVASGEPAAMVVACEDISVAEQVQWALSTPELRLYTSSDVIGVELGGALKNVIAIGAGLSGTGAWQQHRCRTHYAGPVGDGAPGRRNGGKCQDPKRARRAG